MSSPRWSVDALRRALERPAAASSDFDGQAGPAPAATTLRPAGVLLAFAEADGRLLLTRRADGMRHHPGQVALPGGKVDPGDADAVAAALREAREEVGLPAARVDILGLLPSHRTVTGFAITPVLSVLRGHFAPTPEPGEVAEAFWLPFAHVADPARYRMESRAWRGVERTYPVAPFGPYYLWGATARILRALAVRIAG